MCSILSATSFKTGEWRIIDRSRKTGQASLSAVGRLGSLQAALIGGSGHLRPSPRLTAAAVAAITCANLYMACWTDSVAVGGERRKDKCRDAKERRARSLPGNGSGAGCAMGGARRGAAGGRAGSAQRRAAAAITTACRAGAVPV